MSLTPASTELTIGERVYDLTHHTPMMVQYLNLKAQYPNALLLYRMGDFYELFFSDAERAAEILDITLTRRGTDKAGNTIAMAGVPFHAADSYMARLIAAGQTVVVCEQVEDNNKDDAESANKNNDAKAKDKPATGGIMRREVVKTLTAGTITDDALIAPNATPTVAALDVKLPRAGSSQPIGVAVSQLNLAAGTITTQEMHGTDKALEALRTEVQTVLARFAPSECIVSERIDEHWLAWLRSVIDCPVIEVAAADFHPEHAPVTLCQQFAVERLDGLGIQDKLLAQTSSAALIHYARQTQQRQVPQVNQLLVEDNNDYLIMDASSQQNLELFAPVTPNGTALTHVVNHCKTPMGRRLLVQQMKRPLRSRTLINQRLDAIEHLLNPIDDTTASAIDRLQSVLAEIGDVERISSRIALMSAKPRDLRKLADAIHNSARLQETLTQQGINLNDSGLLPILLQSFPAELPAIQETAALIDRAIVDEPPAHIRDGGMLATGYDEAFDKLTHLHDNVQSTLDEMAEEARQTYKLPSLKVGFNKVSGFYFELPKVQAQSAPAHFIRRQTLKNSERFITEELKTLETDYLSAQTRALAREKMLYNALLETLGEQLSALQQFSAAVAHLDVLINWAQLADSYQWQRPIMTDTADSSIDIRGGRHLVVESALRNHARMDASTPPNFVANDCALGSDEYPERLLLITGPNMGGKSTFMRQTALIVLLAHCGSFVPAEYASIGNIDRIFTRIGSADDLAGGKSTFMVEMIETATILNLASAQSLVLMDEVGRGTSTTDGLAIAHACVGRLQAMGCLTLFATHYFELTQLAEASDGVRNVHVAASEVDGQLLLLHKIRTGAASSSFGLHVAKMAGIPNDVVEDAKEYLQNLVQQTQAHHALDMPSHDKNDLANSHADKSESADTKGVQYTDDLFADIADSTDDKPMQNQQLAACQLLGDSDPDALTPKQAHDLLYQLKQLLEC
ncbi:DNA mismatch repair protein MutS [Psychrobacter aestuarii]|uniref:DNA mismatch repair protein MutS n=1 Tax=Psychrobacter aestuarii TaxID=556327 RepID=A0ABP3F9Y8_9GAMM|nr:DNA mismatch repair protein MutS [Psychrobacter aestuarii]